MEVNDRGFESGNGNGQVFIAGAGPGDPELLTLKVFQKIQAADAIAYDALVGAGIVELFPSHAELFCVGKRSGDACSTGQDTIHFLLLRLAREGKSVLRLKGGDPFVFGRGGEEVAFLRSRGIPVEVIPAVSSVNAAAAGAGIPLTQRGVSHSFTVLEGHRRHLDRIDWAALIAQRGTWVFLMAKATVSLIAQRLLEHGAERELPVAVVENASLPQQTVTVLTLATAAEAGYPARSPGPGLMIVGPTVAMAREFGPLTTHPGLDGISVSDLSRFAL